MANKKVKKIPSLLPKDTPAPPPAEDTSQKQARCDAAGKALSALLKQYHVALNVSTLDISSGKIWPQVTLVALDLPQ